MNQLLRIAVVGGDVGKQHFEAFQQLPEHWDVVAVYDIDRTKAQAVATEYGVGRVATDIVQLCRMSDLDVIDICTPPHFRQIQQVLAAGKHAICKKPLVGSLQEADELICAETASDNRVMPVFQYRRGHGLQKLKFLVDEGLAYGARGGGNQRSRCAKGVPSRAHWRNCRRRFRELVHGASGTDPRLSCRDPGRLRAIGQHRGRPQARGAD